jgi:hypothetical protein
MKLRRGFLRLTLVASLSVGIAVATLASKPRLEDFRWRAASAEEKQKAKEWDATPDNKFDPDMFLIKYDGKVLKENQRLLPYQFAVIYFVFPFLLGFASVWLIFFVLSYLIRGFQNEKA